MYKRQVDSPVINDFLIGFIEGAQSVNPDIKVDVRYTNDYVDTAIAKEFGYSMINDNKCDIIWGVAGNAGNGAAEAALETGKAWFIGVDSDQKYIADDVIICSMKKEVGSSIYDAVKSYLAGDSRFGTTWTADMATGYVGIGYGDSGMTQQVPDEVKAAVEELAAKMAERGAQCSVFLP